MTIQSINPGTGESMKSCAEISHENTQKAVDQVHGLRARDCSCKETEISILSREGVLRELNQIPENIPKGARHLLSHSVLWDEQRAMGGVLPDETENVPETYRVCFPPFVHFGDTRQEYDASQTAAVVFDLSDRTQIEVTGRDRQKFVHNFCTNDIKRLTPGESCEAFATDIRGRILAHILVFAGTDSLHIETTSGRAEPLIAHLDRYIISEDVQLHDRTLELGELFLSGPGSLDQLVAVNLLPDALDVGQHTLVQKEGQPLFVRRVDLFGQPGVLLATERRRLADIWKGLVATGIRPAGAATFHACRIKAGVPLYGADLRDDNLAPEAGRTRQAISFTKGCYLGQEPIARIDSVGHVNRELRGLRLETMPVPQPGDAVFADDGQDIGAVTSSAIVPGEDQPIAHAILRSSHTATGTSVFVRVGDTDVRATVFWHE